MPSIKEEITKSGYITKHFGAIHNIENIDKQYKKYFQFFKANYGKYLPRNKDAKIVDMGCGLGDTLYALKRLGYFRSKGVDFSQECVEFCREKGFISEQGDVNTYFLGHKNEFDLVIFNDIIEHFGKDEMVKIINNIFGSLKLGGGIIIKTMNGANAILGTTTLYSDLTHVVMYDEFSLKAMCTLGGFYSKCVEVRPSNLYVYYYNPLNYIAWFVNSIINLILRLYFVLNNKKNKIFTKNIIAVARKNDD